ncbi:calcium/sodium antiporter [Longispora sp. K20-0274]|uniref:calcium/sodium antiporter n=1 Tax=Longispora sp. K20-0274 TaxID=3088255 RepID=UPI00399AF78E
MLPLIGLAIGGLILLTVAADQLVLGAGRLAEKLRIAPVVVGVVVIGLGTSAPEFLVSGLAAHRGEAGLAIGNLVGSNIVNLTLILGIAVLIAPVVVHARIVRREAPLAIAATVAFAGAVLAGLGVWTGGVLAVLFAAALVFLIRLARQPTSQAPDLTDDVQDLLDSARPTRTWVEAARAIAGLAGTLTGAQMLVAGASDLAGRLGVPATVIGFTIVALGTSLPELVTAIAASRRGDTDLLVGNLLGSNLFNSLAGGAIIGLTTPATTGTFSITLLGAMLAISVLAWAFLGRAGRVARPEGLVLLACYAATLPLLL